MAITLNQIISLPLGFCRLRRFRSKVFAVILTAIVCCMVPFALQLFGLYDTGYTLEAGSRLTNLLALRGMKLNNSLLNQTTNVKAPYNNISETMEVRRAKLPAWRQYRSEFSVMELYHPKRSYLAGLIHDLAEAEILRMYYYHRGSQFKFLIKFIDGNKAISKPMRAERDSYFDYRRWRSYLSDTERHTAEIAAYHLDRIFDFRKVPPCTGRVLNFTRDIIQKTKDSEILKTQRTKGGEKCLIGGCREDFCNKRHLTCAKEGLIEVSVCQKIPGWVKMRQVQYPWATSRQHSWSRTNICKNVTKDPIVRKHDLFLNFSEIAVFDHLMLNYDRHGFKTIYVNETKEIGYALFDNGKGFGNPYKDDKSLLAPITQCCRVLKLTKKNSKLSSKMRASLSKDPLDPILTDAYYTALDRRLAQTLSEMKKCLKRFGKRKVFSEKW